MTKKKKLTKPVVKKAVRAVKAKQLHDKGMTRKEIAKKLDCSVSTVGRYLRECESKSKPKEKKASRSKKQQTCKKVSQKKDPFFDVNFWVVVTTATFLTIMFGYFILTRV